MKKIKFLNKIRNLLLNLNIFLLQTSKKECITNFLSKLKPVKSEFEMIRIGGDRDGGYLIPDDLQEISACFSPGVANTISFENDLIKRGITCFLADYSVNEPPSVSKRIKFLKKFIGSKNDERNITLESWISQNEDESKLTGDYILQMDIEGAEYNTILTTDTSVLLKFRIIVIEFHKFHLIFNSPGLCLIESTFDKLLKHFDILHIHPNNVSKSINYKKIEVPPYLEFTFIRKDRIKTRLVNRDFPHKLDKPCVVSKKEITLPHLFYQ